MNFDDHIPGARHDEPIGEIYCATLYNRLGCDLHRWQGKTLCELQL